MLNRNLQQIAADLQENQKLQQSQQEVLKAHQKLQEENQELLKSRTTTANEYSTSITIATTG